MKNEIGGAEYETAEVLGKAEAASARSFVSDYDGILDIEINKEIPIAIISYSDGGNPMGRSLQSYYNMSFFEGADFVQAVTVTFADRAE